MPSISNVTEFMNACVVEADNIAIIRRISVVLHSYNCKDASDSSTLEITDDAQVEAKCKIIIQYIDALLRDETLQIEKLDSKMLCAFFERIHKVIEKDANVSNLINVIQLIQFQNKRCAMFSNDQNELILLSLIRWAESTANNSHKFLQKSRIENMGSALQLAKVFLQAVSESGVIRLNEAKESSIRLFMLFWKNLTRLGIFALTSTESEDHEGIALKFHDIQDNIFETTCKVLILYCKELQKSILAQYKCISHECNGMHEKLLEVETIVGNPAVSNLLHKQMKLIQFIYRAFKSQLSYREKNPQKSDLKKEEEQVRIVLINCGVSIVSSSLLMLCQSHKWENSSLIVADCDVFLKNVLDYEQGNRNSRLIARKALKLLSRNNSMSIFTEHISPLFEYSPQILECARIRYIISINLLLTYGNMMPLVVDNDGNHLTSVIMDRYSNFCTEKLHVNAQLIDVSYHFLSHAIDMILACICRDKQASIEKIVTTLVNYTIDARISMRSFCWSLWRELLCHIWELHLSQQIFKVLLRLSTIQHKNLLNPRVSEVALESHSYMFQCIAYLFPYIDEKLQSSCINIFTQTIKENLLQGPQQRYTLQLRLSLQFINEIVGGKALHLWNAGKEKEQWVAKYRSLSIECASKVLQLQCLSSVQMQRQWPERARILCIAIMTMLATVPNISIAEDFDCGNEQISTVYSLAIDSVLAFSENAKQELSGYRKRQIRNIVKFENCDISQSLLSNCLSALTIFASRLKINKCNGFVRVLSGIHTLLTTCPSNITCNFRISNYLKDFFVNVYVNAIDLDYASSLAAHVIRRGVRNAENLDSCGVLLSNWQDAVFQSISHSNILTVRLLQLDTTQNLLTKAVVIHSLSLLQATKNFGKFINAAQNKKTSAYHRIVHSDTKPIAPLLLLFDDVAERCKQIECYIQRMDLRSQEELRMALRNQSKGLDHLQILTAFLSRN